MDVQSLKIKHNVQLRLLSQIEHFDEQKQITEMVLERLPVSMRKTAKHYKQKIEKSSAKVRELTKSYKNL